MNGSHVLDLDPDYEDVQSSIAKRRKLLENEAKESSVKKIENIIRREFCREVSSKEREIELVDQRLRDARLLLDRLRACAVASYYSQGQGQPSSSQPSVHPAIRQCLGKSLTKNDLATLTSTNEPLVGYCASETAAFVTEQKPQVAPTSVRHVITGDYEKKRIVVGNVSKFIPSDQRDSNDQASHKWMVYVRGPRGDADVSSFVSEVWFHLHPSYKPNDIVKVTQPPFYLTRRGWGEFPVRVQLHFHDLRNKKVDIVHHLKLDRTYTGLQTLGAETVVDVDVARDVTLTPSLVQLTPAQLGGYDVCVQHGEDTVIKRESANATPLTDTAADITIGLHIKDEKESDDDTAMDCVTNGQVDDGCVSGLEVGGSLLSDTPGTLLSDTDMTCDESILHNITPDYTALHNITPDDDNILLTSVNNNHLNCPDTADRQLDLMLASTSTPNTLSNHLTNVPMATKAQLETVLESATGGNEAKPVTNGNTCSAPLTSVLNGTVNIQHDDTDSSQNDDTQPQMPDVTNGWSSGSSVSEVSKQQVNGTGMSAGDYVRCVDKQGRVIMVPRKLLQANPQNSALHRVTCQLKIPPGVASRVSVSPVTMQAPVVTRVKPGSAPPSLPRFVNASSLSNAGIRTVASNLPASPGTGVGTPVRIMTQVRTASLLRSGSSPLLRTPVPLLPVRSPTARLVPAQVSKPVINARPCSLPASRLSVPPAASSTPVTAKASVTPMVSLLKPLHERMLVLPPAVESAASAPAAIYSKVTNDALPASRLISSLASHVALIDKTTPHTVTAGNKTPVEYRTSDSGLTVRTTVGQRTVTLEVPADMQDECQVEEGPWKDLWLDTCQLAALSFANLPTMELAVKSVVKCYPLCRSDQSSFAALPLTHAHFLSWPMEKRRALEWQRAHRVRQILRLKYLPTQPSLTAAQMWTTKHIVTWCRQHAYTPLTPGERRALSQVSEAPPSVISSTLTDSRLLVSGLDELVRGKQTTCGMKEELVDITGLDLDSTVTADRKVKDTVDSDVNHHMSPEAHHVHELCSKVGVWLRSTSVSDHSSCTVLEDMLYAAMCACMEDMVRMSHASMLQRGGEELTLADVSHAITHNARLDFLTNQHLGVKYDEVETLTRDSSSW